MSNKRVIAGLNDKVMQIALRAAKRRAQEIANETDRPVKLESDNGSLSEVIYPEEK